MSYGRDDNAVCNYLSNKNLTKTDAWCPGCDRTSPLKAAPRRPCHQSRAHHRNGALAVNARTPEHAQRERELQQAKPEEESSCGETYDSNQARLAGPGQSKSSECAVGAAPHGAAERVHVRERQTQPANLDNKRGSRVCPGVSMRQKWWDVGRGRKGRAE